LDRKKTEENQKKTKKRALFWLCFCALSGPSGAAGGSRALLAKRRGQRAPNCRIGSSSRTTLRAYGKDQSYANCRFSYSFLIVFFGFLMVQNPKKTKRKPKENQRKPEEKKTAAPLRCGFPSSS
jgi:hypothetical protein